MELTKEILTEWVIEALSHSRAQIAGEAFGVPTEAIDTHRRYVAEDVVNQIWDSLNER